MIHRIGTPCPFAHDDFPLASTGYCCSLCGDVAVDNLEALGERDAVLTMFERMDAGRAFRTASRLRDVVYRLEHQYADRLDKPSGGSFHGRHIDDTGEFIPCPQPSFEEAMTSIRQAADWYEKVGSLGFGVFSCVDVAGTLTPPITTR